MDSGSFGTSTRERILNASRDLFNAQGVQSTAVFKIAEHLAISPGNLTYYFKTKPEIVAALASRLEDEISQVLSGLRASATARENVVCIAAIFQALWQSRFFFNSAAHVSRLDIGLGKRVRTMQLKISDILYHYLVQMKAAGRVIEVANEELRLVGDNISSIWLHWLRHQNISTPKAEKASRYAIRNALAHHLSMIAPYLKPDLTAELRQECDALFGVFADKRDMS